ncbi:hypothetical protein BHE74_00016874, partial [Ensete ventricosum]
MALVMTRVRVTGALSAERGFQETRKKKTKIHEPITGRIANTGRGDAYGIRMVRRASSIAKRRRTKESIAACLISNSRHENKREKKR